MIKSKILKRVLGWPKNKAHLWFAPAIFMTGILLTCATALYVKEGLNAIARKDFIFFCDEIKIKLSTRLHAHAQLLRSASSLFEVSGSISREQWRNAVVRQQIDRNLPGIQGIGYSLIIPPAELARHEQDIRSEGFPFYAVKPVGKRAVYTSIIYLEPFSGRNLRAFGYDMFSEPIRRKAMERARDFDEAALSGRVTLVQESDTAIQAGTLMFVPVYEKGLSIKTVEDRRGAIRGWVYCPYRMNDLMRGILGGWEFREGMHIRLEVFSDDSFQPEGLLYDSKPGTPHGTISATTFSAQTSIVFNGHAWSLRFTKLNGSTSGVDYSRISYVLVGGTVISGLLLVFYLLLVKARNSEERYALTLDAVNDGLWDWNVPSGSAFFSPHYYSLLGYSDREFGANYASWRLLVHPEDLDRVEKELQQSIASGRGFAIDLRMKRKSGEWQWVSTRGRVIERDAEEKALRLVGTLSDIAERKQTEVKIAHLLAEREVLLKEVHHRIKNNMNTMMSLLSLQAKSMKDSGSITALNDARSRIQSMMVLYDKLYRSEGFAELSMEEYLVPLVHEIAGNFPNREVVTIETHVENFILDVRQLSPLGIIVNEFITNMMKHAFAGRDRGLISVSASLKEDHVTIIVQDNGIGLPQSFDLKTSAGFGLRLVDMLTEQIGGTLRIERENGTRFILEFMACTL